jgi:hypothetical protein
LIAQGFYRVQLCGFARRIKAEKDAYRGRNAQLNLQNGYFYFLGITTLGKV